MPNFSAGIIFLTSSIIFEISSVPEEVARAALSLAAYKLPIKTKFIIKPTIE